MRLNGVPLPVWVSLLAMETWRRARLVVDVRVVGGRVCGVGGGAVVGVERHALSVRLASIPEWES